MNLLGNGYGYSYSQRTEPGAASLAGGELEAMGQ